MIERFGNIWDSDVDVVCITTNGTVLPNGRNIMGGGIAKEAVNYFNMARPASSLEYRYGQSILKYGHSLRYLGFAHIKYMLAFPTKYTINEDANLELIRSSLYKLFQYSDIFPEYKIGLPRPGCGLGGLDWETQVKPLVNTIFKAWQNKHEERIIIYHYGN